MAQLTAGDVDQRNDRPLRIAMLAPITWCVPPTGYGPWEQVVYNVTEGLVARGHEVTLFAAAGSRTSARLVETVPHAFEQWPEQQKQRPRRFDPETGLLEGPPDFRALEQQHIATCLEHVADGGFDVVHSHLHVHALVFSRLIPCPLVSSLHGAAWVRAMHPVFDRYRDLPFVSLSDAERTLKPDLNYVGTVYNGVNLARFAFEKNKSDYLLFAGRLSPEKGAAEAVRIAQLAGVPLRMAGMVEPQHEDYFEREIRPHIDGEQVQYLGLLSQKDLAVQYRQARAVLFPISWCEPCSMVGIEAQACGTPLIGTRFGYLPELIRDGETGFLVDTVEQAAAAVAKLDTIDPAACRRNVAERFCIETMAAGYERVFRQVVEAHATMGAAPAALNGRLADGRRNPAQAAPTRPPRG
ncbi:MAG: glycosyltransferase family 4 protein [Phycisphaeraceae bacterium]